MKANSRSVSAVVLLLSSIVKASPYVKRNSTGCGRPPAQIKWDTQCAKDPTAGLPDGTECGTLTVPIDHAKPDDETFELSILRLKTNNINKQGSLFYNLGGPGAASSNYFTVMAKGVKPWSEEILAAYDLIAVDPRGIGRSNALTCDNSSWNTQPQIHESTSEEGFAKLTAFNKAFAESCERMTGNKLIHYMDSVSTVKDFELVRQALGEEKFNFIGFSYGTYLGYTYAELFPDKVGRLVLDSVTDHSTGYVTGMMIESATFQATLEAFFTFCDTDKSCVANGQDLRTIFKNLTQPETQLQAPSCPPGACIPQVTAEDVLTQVHGSLSYQFSIQGLLPGWANLSEALVLASKGDGTPFARTVGQAQDDAQTGAYAHRAVMCQDFGSNVRSGADLKAILDVAAMQTPLTKGHSESLDILVYCAGWPTKITNPPRKLDAKTMAKVPPVLLVNAYLDPSTSPVWALSVREQMPTAVNIWRNGGGHTSYVLFGETSKAMDAFLVKGTMPADGTVFAT